MHKFTVIDVRADGRLLALRDEDKRCHVIRVALPGPPVDALLLGLPASLGTALLLASGGGVFRVSFEHVDLSQADTLVMLHPPDPEPTPASAARGLHAYLGATHPNSSVVL